MSKSGERNQKQPSLAASINPTRGTPPHEGRQRRAVYTSDPSDGEGDFAEGLEEVMEGNEGEAPERPASTPQPGATPYRPRTFTASEIERLNFRRLVNERGVSDITVESLYKPYTLTVLALLCAYLTYCAFSTGESTSTEMNIFSGFKAVFVLFLIVSAMAFPNGPFVRPHPIFWRCVFGVSVLYTLLLQFVLFQSYDDIKRVLGWLDPVGLSHVTLEEKDYAVNCSDVTLERMWNNMDIFAVGHFLGWGMKALLIRHTIICWYISIAWEATEVVFAHLLPNFLECWWDAIVLDVLLCNGLGILFGQWVCRVLEMRQFHWESVKNIRTARGKFKRAVLQFTPESWMKVDWLADGLGALKRCIALYAFIMVWLVSELNTFFLKHVFTVDTSHPVVFWRIILIGLISAPSIRQYYLYATDPKVKRMGMQCWVYMAVCALEAAICVKFGRTQLPSVKLPYIAGWIVMLAVGTVFCVWISVAWARYSSITESIEVKGGEIRECFLDSSVENLHHFDATNVNSGDDVRARRRRNLTNDSAPTEER